MLWFLWLACSSEAPAPADVPPPDPAPAETKPITEMKAPNGMIFRESCLPPPGQDDARPPPPTVHEYSSGIQHLGTGTGGDLLPPPPPPRRGEIPAKDAGWGATVWLSNDDSMSLASAQRILWALDQNASLSGREIRPHELLNYFSFTPPAVPEGRTFGVSGAARRVDDSLAMALTVRGASPPRAPIDLTLLVDRSGSMWEDGRMDYVRRGLTLLTDQLVPGDRIDVVLFDHEACSPLEGYEAGVSPPEVLQDVVSRITPRGSTDLGIGLKEAYRIAADPSRFADPARQHRVILLTDALVNEGELDPDALALVGKSFDDHGVRLTGIGVGRQFSDAVLDEITERGHGAYLYLGSEAVVERTFGAGFPSLVRTVAEDVRFELDLPDGLAMRRFYGEEASADPADIDPVHYQAGNTQLFLQDLQVDPKKFADTDEIALTIHYGEPGGGRKTETNRFIVRDLLAADGRDLEKSRALMAFSDVLLAPDEGACGAAMAVWKGRSASLSGDTELRYVDGLLDKRGCVPPPPSIGARSSVGGANPVRVQMGALADVAVAGDPALALKKIKSYYGQLKYCYETRLKEKPALAGRLGVRLTIGDGKVTDAQIASDTVGDDGLKSCALSKVKRWTMPSDVSGALTVPFEFSVVP